MMVCGVSYKTTNMMSYSGYHPFIRAYYKSLNRASVLISRVVNTVKAFYFVYFGLSGSYMDHHDKIEMQLN